jgi:hypothetical protein
MQEVDISAATNRKRPSEHDAVEIDGDDDSQDSPLPPPPKRWPGALAGLQYATKAAPNTFKKSARMRAVSTVSAAASARRSPSPASSRAQQPPKLRAGKKSRLQYPRFVGETRVLDGKLVFYAERGAIDPASCVLSAFVWRTTLSGTELCVVTPSCGFCTDGARGLYVADANRNHYIVAEEFLEHAPLAVMVPATPTGSDLGT